MTDTMDAVRLGADAGGWSRIEGGWELRFERRLRHSPQRVWTALTTGDGLACWLAEAEIDLNPGGRMDLHFRQPDHEFMPDTPERRRQYNEVLVVEPFSRFEHTFGGHAESVVSWRLRPDGEGTHLTLVHRVPESWADARSKVLSGWHHHMEGLDDAVRGIRHPWSWDRWFALRDAYGARIGEDGGSADYSNDWRSGDFARTVQIGCKVASAFDALTQRIPQWWSRDFKGRADALGAEFTVRFDETHKTMRVVELEPASKVIWVCVASRLDLAGLQNPSEWDGTRIEWVLQPMDGKTVLTVTHAGLTPALACHKACEQGWDHFLMNSLISFLEGGEGRPYESSRDEGSGLTSDWTDR